MPKEYSTLMKIIKYQQLSAGCWQLDSADGEHMTAYKVYQYFIFVTYTIKIFGEIAYICLHTGDMIALGQMFIVLFTGSQFQVRITSIFYRKMIFGEIIKQFREEMFLNFYWKPTEFSKKVSEESYKESLKVASLLLAIFIIGFSNYYAMPVVINILNNSFDKDNEVPMILPLTFVLPYDTRYSNVNWILTFILQYILGYICLASTFSQDAMILHFVINLCGHLKILQHNLKDLSKKSGKQRLNSEIMDGGAANITSDEERIIYNKLRECLIHHQLVIKFYERLQDTFGIFFLSNFCYSVFCLCLLGFQVSTADLEVFIRFIMFLNGALVQLGFICFYCNRLTNESDELMKQIYACDWTGLSHRTKTSLQLFLMRSQKPLQLTALGFTDVSLDTMSNILKSSFSYYTLLRTMDE